MYLWHRQIWKLFLEVNFWQFFQVWHRRLPQLQEPASAPTPVGAGISSEEHHQRSQLSSDFSYWLRWILLDSQCRCPFWGWSHNLMARCLWPIFIAAIQIMTLLSDLQSSGSWSLWVVNHTYAQIDHWKCVFEAQISPFWWKHVINFNVSFAETKPEDGFHHGGHQHWPRVQQVSCSSHKQIFYF